jgi:putative transposase
LTYRRRQQYFADDGDVWSAETGDLYEKYGPVSGTGSAQQLKRKNDAAWDGFLETLDDYHTGELDEKPSPPGYRGNREDGYDLRGYVCNDQYEFTWRNDGSTVEFTIGKTSPRNTVWTGNVSALMSTANRDGTVRTPG